MQSLILVTLAVSGCCPHHRCFLQVAQITRTTIHEVVPFVIPVQMSSSMLLLNSQVACSHKVQKQVDSCQKAGNAAKSSNPETHRTKQHAIQMHPNMVARL